MQRRERLNPPTNTRKTKAFLSNIKLLGGKPFVERMKRWGRTEKGEAIEFHPWYLEYLEAIGDLRIPHTVTCGPSQCGKTLGHTLLAVDTQTQGGVNIAWFYNSRSNLLSNKPEQYDPIAETYVALVETETGERLIRRNDRQVCDRYQIGSATAIFSFVSTSKPSPSKQGLASTGGAAVSFSASLLVMEERSQWIPGSESGLPRRLDAGKIPSKPIRELGTAGSGSGTGALVAQCDYHFYPHVYCPHCRRIIPLDPRGCLLRPVEKPSLTGEPIAKYFSESGKPMEWFHFSENDPVNTAFIGCSRCHKELSTQIRSQAFFKCLKTGIELRRFLDERVPALRGRVRAGMHLSPLVRTDQDLAARIIFDGLNTVSGNDWQQQGLGLESEADVTSLSIEMLKRSLGSPVPTGSPDLILAGVDQGRGEDWLWIASYYFQGGITVQEKFDRAIRCVLWAGAIVRSEIPNRLKQFNVQHGVIDNEPDRESGNELSRSTCLVLADQKPNQLDDLAEIEVEDGGIAYPCWGIRSGKFMKAVLSSFARVAEDGYPLCRLPADWEKWLSNPSERSPIRHLMGPSYEPESGAWLRAKDKIDDLYFAAHFCEAAFMLKLLGKLEIETKMDFSKLVVVDEDL